jgi:hypothetical protein
MVWWLVLVSTMVGMASLPDASSFVDGIAEVGWVTTILMLLVVLSYPSSSIIINQTSVFAGRGCFFTSDALHLIGKPVTN